MSAWVCTECDGVLDVGNACPNHPEGHLKLAGEPPDLQFATPSPPPPKFVPVLVPLNHPAEGVLSMPTETPVASPTGVVAGIFASKSGQKIRAVLGAISLLAGATAGIALAFFPTDPRALAIAGICTAITGAAAKFGLDSPGKRE